MLAHSPPLVYIHEPFNPGVGDRFIPARFPRQFELVTSATQAVYRPAFAQTLRFYYDLPTALKRWGRPRWSRRYWLDIREALLTGARCAVHRLVPLWRPLVKDPIASVSAEWLGRTFSMHVVVLVRHPAGVVSSLLRFRMTTPPEAFLAQPELLARLPGPMVDDLRAAHSEIDQAIMQWRVVNYLLDIYRRRNLHWVVVPFDQLALQPEDTFRSLCERLAVPFTPRMGKLIAQHSDARNPVEPEKSWTLKRNSRVSKDQWKLRLTAEQVDYINKRCGDLWESVSS